MYWDNLEDLELRLATNDDTNRVIQLLKQVAQWMKDHEINQWRFLLEGGDDQEIKQAIANKNTYILVNENENALIATFTVSSKQNEWDIHIWGEDPSTNSIYLHKFAIIPPYMGKGLGRSVLNWIETNLGTDYEYIKLDCVSNNEKLNKFYRSNGFQLIGITNGFSKYQKHVLK